MSAQVFQFAQRTPAPPTVENAGSEGVRAGDGHALPAPPQTAVETAYLAGAQLIEDYRHHLPSIFVKLPDGSGYRNDGWGWKHFDRHGRANVVTVAATCEALTLWVHNRRRHPTYTTKGNQ